MYAFLLAMCLTLGDVKPATLPQVATADIMQLSATKKLDAWVKEKDGRVACVSYAWSAHGARACVTLVEDAGEGKEPIELTVDAATLDAAATKAIEAWKKIH